MWVQFEAFFWVEATGWKSALVEAFLDLNHGLWCNVNTMAIMNAISPINIRFLERDP